MRKFKKAIAIIAAAAMCMGLGMTAFAAPSPEEPENPGVETPEPEYSYWAGYTAKDANGEPITVYGRAVSIEVKKILEDEDAVKDILKEVGFLPTDDQEIHVIGSLDLELDGEMPEGGLDMTMYVADSDVKAGDTVYVMHQKADGTWEVFAAVVGEDGMSVNVHLDSFSPVAIIKVMADGKVVVMDEDENIRGEVKDGKVVENTVKTSPKTGR